MEDKKVKGPNNTWINYYDYVAMMRWKKYKNQQFFKLLWSGYKLWDGDAKEIIDKEDKHYWEVYGRKKDQGRNNS